MKNKSLERNHLWEKGKIRPHLLKPAAVPTMQLGGRGTQKLAAKSLQTNITLKK